MNLKIAVIGSTGRIGRDILDLLAQREFPLKDVFAVASNRSAGSFSGFGEHKILIEDLEKFDFSKVQVAFFAIDDENSLKFIEKARSKGVHIIDNSSAFRMNDDSLLIVPSVNGDEIDDGFSDFVNSKSSKGMLICNPNCCVIPFAILMKSFENSGLKPIRASVSTYQSVSGAGKAAMDELFANTKAKFGPGFSNKENGESVFEYEIAFNCIPKIGSIDKKTGYTSEEIKILEEPKKILKSMKIFDDLKINATCVRVPVFVGHCQTIDIQFDQKNSDLSKLNYNSLCEILDQNEQIDFFSNEIDHVITPQDCVKRDEVSVCRLRIDQSTESGISLFIVSDNLHNGGALNAVQIFERLIQNF
jgi:aspartate-semialdehyde dehydrogenase